MNVLIVGDSFAASNNVHGWVNLLRSRVTSVTCLAEGGTSLFYSYKKLLEEDLRKYDFVIVMVTQCGRLSFPDAPHYNSQFTAENYIYDPDPRIRSRAQAALHYYLHLANEEVDQFLHNSILGEIRRLLLDTRHVLQPGFDRSLIKLRPPVTFRMIDITDKQNEGIPEELFPRIFNPKEKLTNHLSYSNNQVLCDYFYDIITKGSTDITIRNFNRLEEPVEQWFTN